MKHTFTIILAFFIAMIIAGCKGKTENNKNTLADSIVSTVNDTALYGVIGEGTTMNVLELLSDGGKTLEFEIDPDGESQVIGGLYAGDRVTLTFQDNGEGTKTVTRLVNLTSILGWWTSLDRNFRLQEDGVIESSGISETHPYTHWAMSNTQIILNTDTFDVLQLGPDSMSLENSEGIYVYKRQK